MIVICGSRTNLLMMDLKQPGGVVNEAVRQKLQESDRVPRPRARDKRTAWADASALPEVSPFCP
jgi:hypothetical protein